MVDTQEPARTEVKRDGDKGETLTPIIITVVTELTPNHSMRYTLEKRLVVHGVTLAVVSVSLRWATYGRGDSKEWDVSDSENVSQRENLIRSGHCPLGPNGGKNQVTDSSPSF